MQLRRAKIGTRRRAEPAWEGWAADDILKLRMCDLGVRLQDSWVEPLISRLVEDLADRDLRLRPHFWLSDEWQSPDGVPGVGVPFYLVHRRLMNIERAQMLEVEGGTKTECLKLLRHEVGHAVHNGFALHRRKRWQRLFGAWSKPYPRAYRPNPASRHFVQHLEGWYAQAHPAEDWAETFAVWLGPRSQWRREYASWPALEKLEYVEEVMGELAGARPLVTTRRQPYSVAQLRTTLAAHYAQKRSQYGRGWSSTYDDELLRVFTRGPQRGALRPAKQFIREHRAELRDRISRATGTHRLTVDYTLKEIMGRCEQLGLVMRGSEGAARDALLITLTSRIVQLQYRRPAWRTV